MTDSPTGPPVPAPKIETEYSFTVRAVLQPPMVIGQVPNGLRRFVPIVGGSVSGPRIKGTVASGGGDSQIVRSDGVLSVCAQYVIVTDDDVRIAVINQGLRHGPSHVIERLTRGEPVSPGDYYFRTCPQFEAPSGSKYHWMNESLFVATAEREATAAIINVFAVL